MRLKWSIYNIYYKSKYENHTILTNSLNSNVYKLNYNFLKKINEFLFTDKIEDSMKKHVAELYVDRFLVDTNIDEEKVFIISHEKEKESMNVGNVYFIPSFECDFRCNYCIVGKKVDTTCFARMTKSDIIKTARWLYNRTLELDIKTLQILLFGGEPLLSHKENLILMDELNSIRKPFDVNYNLITNGYMLTPRMLEELISRRLSSVQITLDGPEDIHNSRRHHANGSKTFKTIINNLMNIVHYNIRIIIRVNVDEENCFYIIELLKYLHSLELNKRILLHIVPVDPSSYSPVSGYTLKALEAYQGIYQFAFANNFNVQKWKRFCSISSKMNFSIDAYGNVYSCPNYVGEINQKIADIHNGFTNNYSKILHQDLDNNCINCKYIGMCNGGCLSMKELFKTDKCIFYEANSKIDESYTLAKYQSNNLDVLRLGKLTGGNKVAVK